MKSYHNHKHSFAWQQKNDSFRENDKNRARKRKLSRLMRHFRSKIQNKFWWDSLTDRERFTAMKEMSEPVSLFPSYNMYSGKLVYPRAKTEKEMIEIYPNVSKMRSNVIDRLIN